MAERDLNRRSPWRFSTRRGNIRRPANEGLRAALDRVFAEPDRPPYRWVKAIVVLHDGVVAERYAPGHGIGTPLLGYSATKSVTSDRPIRALFRAGRI